MKKLIIYGEAQFERALADHPRHLVFFYDTDSTSDAVYRHLCRLEKVLRDEGVRVLTIARGRLPTSYYHRRAIATFPSVAFFSGRHEVARTSGIMTHRMLENNIRRHGARPSIPLSVTA